MTPTVSPSSDLKKAPNTLNGLTIKLVNCQHPNFKNNNTFRKPDVTMGGVAFNLETCARPNIVALQPYRCARDDYKDDGSNTLLDANENSYGPSLSIDLSANHEVNGSTLRLAGLNRYPDPHQIELKQLLCDLRQVASSPATLRPDNIFVGVGSDEAIDGLIRCFCVPGIDKILVCPPTYGMYTVAAQVNDVEVVKVPLEIEGESPSFDIQPVKIKEELEGDPRIKMVYICSPGNPTGKLVDPGRLKELLEYNWNGVVVLDEAYIDFANHGKSLAHWVNDYPNLVVMQTLSKAFGMAGIRRAPEQPESAIQRLFFDISASNTGRFKSRLGGYEITPGVDSKPKGKVGSRAAKNFAGRPLSGGV
ncbi:histidinol-phosphate transaminase [Orbilia oligospora]|uniref:histidinol-phosphate transaminase n=1 Tax=Orbilia oligospora TaxID=2813651 RepID=A0A7C8JIW4_ORBOL|nr:histidinol-phosphate transaminase [Orbilia oligospora]